MSSPPARTPPGPLDRAAAAGLWRQFAAAHPEAVTAGQEPSVERFGDSAEMADELLCLVVHGPKRATAGLVADFAAEDEPLPRIGAHRVACDRSGAPRVVLRSVELRVGGKCMITPGGATGRARSPRVGSGAGRRGQPRRSRAATSAAQ